MTSFIVDYFEIPAFDAAKSREFFTQAFGWSSQGYGPDYEEIRGAGVLGGINGDATDHSAQPLVGIRTDDIAAAERAVLGAGGRISRPTYDYPGGKRFFFVEPGGAELLVYCPNA